jgi:hypothetical protein
MIAAAVVRTLPIMQGVGTAGMIRGGTMKDVLDLLGLLLVTTLRDRSRSACRPARLPSAIKHEEVASHRSLSCKDYDACLGEVLLLAWPSWTCRRCSRFALRGQMRAFEIAHEGARRIVP